MTDLEFIEKEIEQCKDFIETLKRDEKLGFKWENVDIKEIEERIEHLQQIKTKLEAWEIAKNKSVDLYDVKTSQDAEEFNCDLYTDYQLTAEELNKLKKALKVDLSPEILDLLRCEDE